jgi:DNA-binding NtrC family response regulator
MNSPCELDPKRQRRVLLADDDPDFRLFLAATLRSDGHEVIEASDGADLLDRLGGSLLEPEQGAIDLVITDVRMPSWSGLQALASLAGRGWPVVVITAFGSPKVHEDAARLGAVASFDKPFDIDELREIVRAELSVDRSPPLRSSHDLPPTGAPV